MPHTFKSPIVALLASSILWGVAGPIIKYTLQFTPPFTFLVIRFLIASLILYFFIDWKKHNYLKQLKLTGFIKIFLLGILGSSINLGLYFVAIDKTSAIEGAIIYSMGPVFVFLGGILFLKEKVSSKEMLGYLVTLMGFLVIIVSPLFKQTGLTIQQHLLGNILMLLAAISWGAYAVLSKKFFSSENSNKSISPAFLTFITSFAGAVTLLPLCLYEIFTTNINYIQALPGILYMAIASSILAFYFYNYGVKKIDVTHVSLFEYLTPAITLPTAILFLGEAFSYWYVVGFILLAIGLYITERVPKHIRHLKKVHREHKKIVRS